MLRPAHIVIPLTDQASIQDALDTMTYHNRLWLRRHPRTPSLLAAGVRYEREDHRVAGRPSGFEQWQTLPELLRSRKGDCEDLACGAAAPIRGARAIARPSPVGFHIIVRRSDGSVFDPSKRLGM